MKKVLEGIRVIDWTTFINGPESAALLGDLGAEVIKVEQKGVGDGHRGTSNILGVPSALPQGRHATFEHFNRNKRGIAIDLKNPKGREVMHRLIKSADVFVTNYMPNLIAKFELDYATLSGMNPRLIHASSTIYGDRGPEKDIPGFDMSALARSGVLMTSGDASMDGPCWLELGMADEAGGSTLAFGILSALMARERYGFGQEVKSSVLGAMIKLQAYNFSLRLHTGSGMPRLKMDTLPPTSRFYKCQDDRWIQLSMFREVEWAPFCRAIDHPEVENDPRFNSLERRQGNTDLVKLLEAIFARKDRAVWLDKLRRARLPHSAVNTADDVVSDPMVLENNYVVDYDHPVLGKMKTLGFPWRFSRTPAQLSRPAPEFGEHTEEVLIEVGGYSWEEIALLKEEGAI